MVQIHTSLNRSAISLTLIMILMGLPIYGQNLVPNPSFETYSACPGTTNQLNRATGWQRVAGHNGSPDYFNSCAPAASLIDVPNNVLGSQAAYNGNAYAGHTVFLSSTTREYFYCQLLSPMVAGTTYSISYQVSLAENSSWGTDNGIQVYFSNAPVAPAVTWGIITGITPSAINTVVVDDKSSWTQINMTYTATGGEQYMTFGNFLAMALVNTYPVTGGLSSSFCFTYVDDVVVEPVSTLPVELTEFTIDCSEENIDANWKTLSERDNAYFVVQGSDTPNDQLNWLDIGTKEGAGNSSSPITYSMDVSNSKYDYYRIKQVDFSGKETYYSTKSLNCDSPLTKVFFDQQNMSIQIVSEAAETNYGIYDLTGKKVLSGILNDSNQPTPVSASSLSKGVYLVQVGDYIQRIAVYNN